MAKFTVNKGYGTGEYTFEAEDYTEEGSFVTFRDADNSLVASVKTSTIYYITLDK